MDVVATSVIDGSRKKTLGYGRLDFMKMKYNFYRKHCNNCESSKHTCPGNSSLNVKNVFSCLFPQDARAARKSAAWKNWKSRLAAATRMLCGGTNSSGKRSFTSQPTQFMSSHVVDYLAIIGQHSHIEGEENEGD